MCCVLLGKNQGHLQQQFAIAPCSPAVAICSRQLPPCAPGDDLGSFSLFWGHQLWPLGLSSAEDKAQRCNSTAGAMPCA